MVKRTLKHTRARYVWWLRQDKTSITKGKAYDRHWSAASTMGREITSTSLPARSSASCSRLQWVGQGEISSLMCWTSFQSLHYLDNKTQDGHMTSSLAHLPWRISNSFPYTSLLICLTPFG